MIDGVCSNVAEQSLSIIEAIAPLERVIGSPLASCDGEVYKKFVRDLFGTPNTFTREKVMIPAMLGKK